MERRARERPLVDDLSSFHRDIWLHHSNYITKYTIFIARISLISPLSEDCELKTEICTALCEKLLISPF